MTIKTYILRPDAEIDVRVEYTIQTAGQRYGFAPRGPAMIDIESVVDLAAENKLPITDDEHATLCDHIRAYA